MAWSPSHTEIRARYCISLRLVDKSSGNLSGPTPDGGVYKEYCETFADVKLRLKHHVAYMKRHTNSRLRFIREPKQWYASAVQHVCKTRRQVYHVAVSCNNSAAFSEVLSVIAL